MQLDEALQTGAIHLPWPISVSGKIFDGHIMRLSNICQKKCGSASACASSFANKGEGVCIHGMSYFQIKVKEYAVTIMGVRALLSKIGFARRYTPWFDAFWDRVMGIFKFVPPHAVQNQAKAKLAWGSSCGSGGVVNG